MANFNNERIENSRIESRSDGHGHENDHKHEIVREAWDIQNFAGDNMKEVSRSQEIAQAVEIQAARIVASVMKSFDRLPLESQMELVRGLRPENYGTEDVVYNTFLKNIEARNFNQTMTA